MLLCHCCSLYSANTISYYTAVSSPPYIIYQPRVLHKVYTLRYTVYAYGAIKYVYPALYPGTGRIHGLRPTTTTCLALLSHVSVQVHSRNVLRVVLCPHARMLFILPGAAVQAAQGCSSHMSHHAMNICGRARHAPPLPSAHMAPTPQLPLMCMAVTKEATGARCGLTAAPMPP